MDIKPTKEKKKKRVTKQRADELNRRRESFLQNFEQDDDSLLSSSKQCFTINSNTGSRRGSGEGVEEEEEPVVSDEDTAERGEDLWMTALPVAVSESSWRSKTRRASSRRRSSGLSDEDIKATLVDKLRMEKVANAFKVKDGCSPKYFWDDEDDTPKP